MTDPLAPKPYIRAAITALRAAQESIETAHAEGDYRSPAYFVGPDAHVPPTIAAITAAIAQLSFWSDRLQWAYDMGYLPGGHRHKPTDDNAERIIR